MPPAGQDAPAIHPFLATVCRPQGSAECSALLATRSVDCDRGPLNCMRGGCAADIPAWLQPLNSPIVTNEQQLFWRLDVGGDRRVRRSPDRRRSRPTQSTSPGDVRGTTKSRWPSPQSTGTTGARGDRFTGSVRNTTTALRGCQQNENPNLWPVRRSHPAAAESTAAFRAPSESSAHDWLRFRWRGRLHRWPSHPGQSD